jgi:hypothetical protein
MNLARFHLSERTQVVSILLLTLGILLAIWYFLLLPQRQMNEEIEKIRHDLAANQYAHESIHSLKQAAQAELAQEQRLKEEWEQTVTRLATFANQAALRRDVVGRIDFKVELFRTRQRLVHKSDTLKIQLIPTDLGVDDALLSNDEICERNLQLKAVERLADLTLDRRIERLIAITPLPPKRGKAPDGRSYFAEYPMQVEFDIAFSNLYALLQSVLEENQIFIFRSLRIDAGPRDAAPVRVHAVMSALVFE